MGRRREPSARELLKAMGIDPLHELAEHALTLKKGTPERIETMWQLLPYVHSKLRPIDVTVEAKSSRARVVTVEIGGDE